MISQPIDQKPIAETLTGQEGDNIIVPSDEVWYVSMVGDSDINISLTGNTTTGEYNYGSRRVGKPNQEPLLQYVHKWSGYVELQR